MVELLLGTHSHQPVGNFDHVFQWAYETAYKPFIDVLREYPDFKITLHFTGPLMDWFEGNHPEFNETIAAMVENGQAEIVISGFYEPVLWAIPHRDRLAQIEKAAEFVRRRYGAQPKGLWLTERVWESDVARSLVEYGIEYVLVDDFHFLCAGKKSHELHGYYLTEYEGKPLAIFPIDQKLRYLIPFRPIHEVMDYLREVEEKGGNGAIIFDDGEKFGVWPGTYDWVYDKGWLEMFIRTILETGWVKTSTYSEFMESHPPIGRIYLPSASYFEMSEWSLPAERAVEFSEFVHRLQESGEFDRVRPFIRGGTWPNFLVKYEESNRMHKKMVYLSRAAWEKNDREAIDAIHRAQCNDAYWHGVFGGLYLPHLRHAVYSNLIKAEQKITPIPSVEVTDIDLDGHEEVILRNNELSVQIAPARGGGVTELSSFRHLYNLGDTLRRRFEHYHKSIRRGEKKNDGVASIHEIERVVDEKTFAELKYDWHERLSFIEHFLPENAGIKEFHECSFHDLGDFTLGTYNFEVNGDMVRLHRHGKITENGTKSSASITKTFSLNGNALSVLYHLEVPSEQRFGVELNISLPSSDNQASKIIVDGREMGSPASKIDVVNARTVRLADVSGMRITIESDRDFETFILPIYTVSQSESGLELTYQETAILLIYRLKSGSSEFGIKVKVE